jgi:hypothetical protein
MDFIEAMKLLSMGQNVRNKKWLDKNEYIYTNRYGFLYKSNGELYSPILDAILNSEWEEA